MIVAVPLLIVLLCLAAWRFQVSPSFRRFVMGLFGALCLAAFALAFVLMMLGE